MINTIRIYAKTLIVVQISEIIIKNTPHIEAIRKS